MQQTILTQAFSLLAPMAALQASAQSAKPNIVFLLADDLGGGDLHCYWHPYARTPNIDSLARDGTRLLQFYATGSTCCPARTGLMTSKFPATYPTYPANGGFATRAVIHSTLGQPCQVRYGDKVATLNIKAGGSVILDKDMNLQ